MSKFKSFSITLSAAALMAATPALADITADELWALWQEHSTAMGQPMTAEATVTGDGLILSNLGANFDLEEFFLSTRIDQVTMVNQPDGTVAISISDTATYRAHGFEGGSDPAEFVMVLGLTDYNVTASGTADILTLDSTVGMIEMLDASFLNIDPSEVPEINLAFSIADISSSATYDLTDAAFLRFDGSSSVGPVAIAVEAFEPVGGGGTETPPGGGGFQPVTPEPTTPSKQANQAGGHFAMSMNMGPSQATVTGALPLGMNLAELETFPVGLEVDADVTYEAFDVDIDFRDGRDMFDMSASNAGGSIGYGLSTEALRFAFNSNNVAISVAATDMPFPVAIAADSTAFGIDIPLARADAPSPFSTQLAYQGVTVDDSLWAMVDPGGMVPRTPASVIVDMSGTVQIFMDILTLDPDTLNAPPGELRHLTLNNLQVSFGGAELTGVGDLDFTPGQIIPVPVGSVDLSLTGGNGLIQTLSNAGLLPPQQAGMARGMLGMFAVPGSGPDSYTSSIEFTAQGGISANGVPLR